MKKAAEIKRKKTINDLLDKKFSQLDKIVGGTIVACDIVQQTPPLVPGGCYASTDGGVCKSKSC